MKKSYHCKVQKIIDGDAFKTQSSVDNSQYVRIICLNYPEKDQLEYLPTKQKLTRNIQDNTITVKPKARSYGRIISDVIHRQKCLGGKC